MDEATRNEQCKVGEPVIYFDEYRRKCHALLEAVHGSVREHNGILSIPCVNLTYISPDREKVDGYGRQKEHRSSCVHASNQQERVGNYWVFPDEVHDLAPLAGNVATQK